jgi:hypothetical protein
MLFLHVTSIYFYKSSPDACKPFNDAAYSWRLAPPPPLFEKSGGFFAITGPETAATNGGTWWLGRLNQPEKVL